MNQLREIPILIIKGIKKAQFLNEFISLNHNNISKNKIFLNKLGEC